MLACLVRKRMKFSGNLVQTWKLGGVGASARGRRRMSSGAEAVVAKERADCVVIGAGVLGLAVARELSRRGREVLVLDAAASFGAATSSRNSEVVHAGIYYPPNSLKAKFCVRGRELLYRYCSEHGIPHRKMGKLIVATGASEIPKLDLLMHLGTQNGVAGLRMLEGFEAMRMEPRLRCVKALLSPESGILDTHSLMLSLVGEAETGKTTFSYNTTVLGGRVEGNQIHLHVAETRSLESWNGGESLSQMQQLELIPNLVVNSAGLAAQALTKRFHGINHRVIPPSHYARGCYFMLSGSRGPPFDHLVYPIPEEGGLGVHFTVDLTGQVKFGPDVEWIDGVDDISSFLNRFDYVVNPKRAEKFYPEIRKYYPELKDESLEPGYSGIRPKLSGPKQPPADFVIQGGESHGVHGLVNLFGIESPGFTSSLAIAEHIATRFLK
ncbi:PREDICTED: L-2-hydroxyglutarate dehydrogenase, mitochondrial-like [Tarenaya hassleriana]|uniref:L-2-hydroxyglutarate dehydrogenase, mitochondrial-like n=2 Tax=Tarenaya hassleriana TaxID=28532 RepID=UPI00053C764F|nr:PREDICTED: L-2-hydroxyglutarate dehydrogenase, mitochondrial-like [Tarenaya hassleriana]